MIPPGELAAYGTFILRRTRGEILESIASDPAVALSRIPDPDKPSFNQPLRVDYYAEDSCAGDLRRRFPGKIVAVGEESLQKRGDLQDLTNQQSVVALMDIIDGTDLLARDLSNWCSAIVFFYPPSRQILASVVSDYAGRVFFATADQSGAFFQASKSRSAVPLSCATRPRNLLDALTKFHLHEPSGPSQTIAVHDASVYFVGQRPHHVLSIWNTNFHATIEELATRITARTSPVPAFRLYNLGGIPMALKVANGTADAVFDLTKPKPYDMVAGAYIALKAGAFLGDTSGTPITEADLATALLTPAADGPAYVLASTRSLCDDILRRFCGAAPVPF